MQRVRKEIAETRSSKYFKASRSSREGKSRVARHKLSFRTIVDEEDKRKITLTFEGSGACMMRVRQLA